MPLTKEQRRRRCWNKLLELLGGAGTAVMFAAIVILMFALA